MSEGEKGLVYTIGFLEKKRDIVTRDINGLYESIKSHKQSIKKMEARIPWLKEQIIALDKAIEVLKSVQEEK